MPVNLNAEIRQTRPRGAATAGGTWGCFPELRMLWYDNFLDAKHDVNRTHYV